MTFDLETIARLAPDEKSILAARQSMSLRLWSHLGFSPAAVWGYCRGSSTYEVAVDLSRLGYRCNCPSRKRPCRHALALLLLMATHPDVLAQGEPPEAIERWLKQRQQKEAKQSSKPPAPFAETPSAKDATRAKRISRREIRVQDGVEQLQQWLCDLIRNGLAGIELQGTIPWEEQARRLVDAQASGLANRVRSLGDIVSSSPDWPKRLLDAIGRLQLLIRAYQRLAELPEDLQSEVRQLVGWNLTQRDLEASGKTVADDWFVIGQREEEDDRFRIQRTWLWGRNTQRTALVLQFAPGREPFAASLPPGTIVSGTLLFYPGTSQQRARPVDLQEPIPFQDRPPACDDWETVLDNYAHLLSKSPWLAGSAYLISNATIVPHDEKWLLRDRTGNGLPLYHPAPWRLLALTEGEPVDVAFEWNGVTSVPLGIIRENRYTRV